MRIALAGVLGFFLIVAQVFAAEEPVEKTITRSFPVRGGGELTVDAEQGDIQVVAGSGNKVEVVVEREVAGVSAGKQAGILKHHKVTFSQDGNNVHVEAAMSRSHMLFSRSSSKALTVHFRITVPRRFSTMLNTSGGGIEVTGLKGTVEAQSSGGDLSFTNIEGAVEGHTSGGNVRAAGCSDKVVAQTSGGNIWFKDLTGASATADTLGGNVDATSCEGTLQIKTSGGNINIGNYSGTSVYADTSGGSIAFDLTRQPSGACWFRTNGGNITGHLAGEISVNLNAISDGGSVTSEFPVTDSVPGKAKEGVLEGKINGGGPVLTLRTSGGNIQVLKLKP